MTIAEELKKLVKARGGDGVGVMTIMDGVKALTKLETENEEEPVDEQQGEG